MQLATRPALTFARHYAEMVVAMFLGMVVRGMLPSMLAAMLLRRDEYTGHAGHRLATA
jgi:hypothetical protein